MTRAETQIADLRRVVERMEAVRRRAEAIVGDRELRREHDRLRRASCGCASEHATLAEWERAHGAVDLSRPFRGGR